MRRLVAGLFAIAGAIAGLGLAAQAQAQYPERPIKLIVPWAAGGDTDNIFRPFAPMLQKHIGQTVVIANVGGASGTVGAREAKAAPPDGYTVYAVHDYIHSTYYAGLSDVKSGAVGGDEPVSPRSTNQGVGGVDTRCHRHSVSTGRVSTSRVSTGRSIGFDVGQRAQAGN